MSNLPRLEPADLHYRGAFRLPRTVSNDQHFSFGGRPIAFDPRHQSLFCGNRAGMIAEVSIPAPLNSTDINALGVAEYRQGFVDPTHGRLASVGEGAGLGGLLVIDDRLYFTGFVYYDSNNLQRISHGAHATDLRQQDFTGFVSVGDPDRTGYVAGYLAVIPDTWREALKGGAVTGQWGVPIESRTSLGPALFGWHPVLVNASQPSPAVPLVYYDGAHPTLGIWNAQTPTYGATSSCGGVVLVAGTRTALFFGATGLGPLTYGTEGDPLSSDKGSHAYPYRFQVWAYDLEDCAQVASGQLQPWDVVPYGVWPIAFPIATTELPNIGGVAYDAATQTIYVSETKADRDGFGYRALIHAFQVGVPSVIDPPVPVDPPIVVSDDGGLASTMTVRDTFAATSNASTPAKRYDEADAMIKEKQKRTP